MGESAPVRCPQEMPSLASPFRELKAPRTGVKQHVQLCLIQCFPVSFVSEQPPQPNFSFKTEEHLTKHILGLSLHLSDPTGNHMSIPRANGSLMGILEK